MKTKEIILDNEESSLLEELEANTWLNDTLTDDELKVYKESVKYTKSLSEIEELEIVEYIESKKSQSIENLSDTMAKIKSAVTTKYDKS